MAEILMPYLSKEKNLTDADVEDYSTNKLFRMGETRPDVLDDEDFSVESMEKFMNSPKGKQESDDEFSVESIEA